MCVCARVRVRVSEHPCVIIQVITQLLLNLRSKCNPQYRQVEVK